MSTGTPKSPSVLLHFVTIILLTTPPSASSLPISLPVTTIAFHSLFSLSHSLITRVADIRAARGDISGSIRARSIAQKIETYSHQFSFHGFMYSVDRDSIKNNAWRDVKRASFEMYGAVTDMKELMKSLNELTKLESQVERVEWVRQNYSVLLKLSKSTLNRLLKVFTHSGPLKDAIEMVETEMVDGGLLRDCLDLVSGDLKGVIQMLKEVGLQYSSTNRKTKSDSEL